MGECDLSEAEIAKLEFVISGLGRGVAWPEAKWVILAGAEILGRTETGRGYRRGKNLAGEKLKRPAFDSGELKLGDYAVHLPACGSDLRRIRGQTGRSGAVHLTTILQWGETLCSGGGILSGVSVCGGGKEKAHIGYVGRWKVGAG